jgi:hypothetical protein
MKPVPCAICNASGVSHTAGYVPVFDPVLKSVVRKRHEPCCGTGFLLIPERGEERVQKLQQFNHLALDERPLEKEGAGSTERLASKEGLC